MAVKTKFEDRPDWPEFLKLKDELSLRELADHFGVTVNTINRVVQRNGLSRQHAKSGRPPKDPSKTAPRKRRNAKAKAKAKVAPVPAEELLPPVATEELPPEPGEGLPPEPGEGLPPEPGEVRDADTPTVKRKSGRSARLVERAPAVPAEAPAEPPASKPARGRKSQKALGVAGAKQLSQEEAPKARNARGARAARPASDTPTELSPATAAARKKYALLEAFYPELVGKTAEDIARRTGIDVEAVRVFLEQKRLNPPPVEPAKAPSASSTPRPATTTVVGGSKGWQVELIDGTQWVVIAPSLHAAVAQLGARESQVKKLVFIGPMLNS